MAQAGRKGMGPCAVRQFGDDGQGAFLETVSTAYMLHVLPGYGALPGFIQYVADHIVMSMIRPVKVLTQDSISLVSKNVPV